jgi:hypothetical protein
VEPFYVSLLVVVALGMAAVAAYVVYQLVRDRR